MSIAQYALSFCGIVRLPSLAGLEDDPRRLVVGLHRPTVQKDWTDFSAARGKSYVSVARRRDRQPPTPHLRVAQRMTLSTVVEIRRFRLVARSGGRGAEEHLHRQRGVWGKRASVRDGVGGGRL